mmetsp:Transcript_34397/g.81475  ORF Transcript_34397/g.81475 Transcript_34397/m.81475 type:complete len:193 (-) Transcript_34397:327-905(-)
MPSNGNGSPTQVLRAPFKHVLKAGSYTATTVNSAVDGTMDSCTECVDSVLKNKYVKSVTNQITSFGDGALNKFAPVTSKVSPWVSPLVKKTKPYAPAAAVTVVALATPPVLTFCAIVAFFTAPIWMFFGLITSFIWVPALIIFSAFAIVFGTFAAFVAGVRYASSPSGQAKLTRVWRKVSGSPMGQKLFFVN